jgi:hypothetical protein
MSHAKLQNRLDTLKSERTRVLNTKASMVMAGKETTSEFRDLDAQLNTINGDIVLIEKLTSMPGYAAVQEQQAAQERSVQDVATAQQVTAQVVEGVANVITNSDKSGERSQRLEQEMRSYLRTGQLSELRDVSVSDTNGATVAQSFGLITEATRFSSQIVSEIYVYNDANGSPVKLPVSDDTQNGLTVIPETDTTSGIEFDPSVISTVNAGADILVGRVDYSKQFSDDSVAGYLQRLVGPRVARSLAREGYLAWY